MAMNSDWGAVAYLSHSSYGLGNVEIELNNNQSYWPGSGTDKIYGKTNTYLQSTTGNIYGVFDMSGGALEYVMGVLDDGTGNGYSGSHNLFNSGFNGLYGCTTECINVSPLVNPSIKSKTDGIPFPNKKYYKTYIEDLNNDGTNDWNKNTLYLGEALGETRGWYSDHQNFIPISRPWFVRGGKAGSDVSAGIFAFSHFFGDANSDRSFRVVVTTE